MRWVLRAGALGRPRGMEWRGRREGGSGWGTHVNSWLIHVNVWQKPLQLKKKNISSFAITFYRDPKAKGRKDGRADGRMDGWMEGSKQSMKGGENKERKGKERKLGKGKEGKKKRNLCIPGPAS